MQQDMQLCVGMDDNSAVYATKTNAQCDPMALTIPAIDKFIDAGAQKGRAEYSLKYYRRYLERLYYFLPEDKLIHGDTLYLWRKEMIKEGLSACTINARISSANSLLGYYGHWDLQLHGQLNADVRIREELTRAEYMQMLRAAKVMKEERAYFLIKTFGCIGVKVGELKKITVQTLKNNSNELPSKYVVRMTEVIRNELIEYANRHNIQEGPIFRSGRGTPMIRSSIHAEIQKIGEKAHIDSRKSNPTSLARLCAATYRSIEDSAAFFVIKAYNQMLSRENQQIDDWF